VNAALGVSSLYVAPCVLALEARCLADASLDTPGDDLTSLARRIAALAAQQQLRTRCVIAHRAFALSSGLGVVLVLCP
jgi:hypothetical protein